MHIHRKKLALFALLAVLAFLALFGVACTVFGGRTQPTPTDTPVTIAGLKATATATPVATPTTLVVATFPGPTYTPLPPSPWTPMPTLSPEDEQALKEVARMMAVAQSDGSLYRDLDSYRQYLSEFAYGRESRFLADNAEELEELLSTAQLETLEVKEPQICYDDKRSGPMDYIVTVRLHQRGTALGQTIDEWTTVTLSMTRKEPGGNWVVGQYLGWDTEESEE